MQTEKNEMNALLNKSIIKSFFISFAFYIASLLLIFIISALGLIFYFFKAIIAKNSYIDSGQHFLISGLVLFLIPSIYSIILHFKSSNKNKTITKGYIIGTTCSFILSLTLFFFFIKEKRPKNSKFGLEDFVGFSDNASYYSKEIESYLDAPTSDTEIPFEIMLLGDASISRNEQEYNENNFRIEIEYFISSFQIEKNTNVWIIPVSKDLEILKTSVSDKTIYDTILDTKYYRYFLEELSSSKYYKYNPKDYTNYITEVYLLAGNNIRSVKRLFNASVSEICPDLGIYPSTVYAVLDLDEDKQPDIIFSSFKCKDPTIGDFENNSYDYSCSKYFIKTNKGWHLFYEGIPL